MTIDLMTRIGITVSGEGCTVTPALRDNPRRLHLLVSGILGKHVPCDPVLLAAAADGLARQITGQAGAGVPVTVLGFAETATALGARLACALSRTGHSVWSLCSTRHVVRDLPCVVEFTEPHSHAADHRLYAADPVTALAPDRLLVLADDELSTGVTAANAIRALHTAHPRTRYVVATLTDARPGSAEALRALSAELGVRIDVIAQSRVRVQVAPNARDAAAEFGVLESGTGLPQPRLPGGDLRVLPVTASASDPLAGVQMPDQRTRLAAERMATMLCHDLPIPPNTQVLGVEEDMLLAHLVAQALPSALTSATTRSPAFLRTERGYPLRSRVSYRAADGSERFAYNTPVGDSAGRMAVRRPRIVVVHGPRYTADIPALATALTDAGADVRVAPYAYSPATGRRA